MEGIQTDGRNEVPAREDCNDFSEGDHCGLFGKHWLKTRSTGHSAS